jgi:hypothetical protein
MWSHPTADMPNGNNNGNGKDLIQQLVKPAPPANAS